MKKTNVMRLLDSRKIDYKPYEYDTKDGALDGVSVAGKINKPVEDVYKTLVCKGAGRDHYVFIIPVAEELDLKAAARAVGEKSVEMIKVSDINKLTGYERGGCSPIGMKKEFLTVLSEEAGERDRIIVSAGLIGSQIEVNPNDIGEFVEIRFAKII